jgi:hypothetical protein
MRIPDAAVEPVIKPDGLPSRFAVLNTRPYESETNHNRALGVCV